MKLRKEKKEKVAKKAKEAREQAELMRRRVEDGERMREQRTAELHRLMAEQQRDNEATSNIARSELKRREQAAKRAEKRAQKFG